MDRRMKFTEENLKLYAAPLCEYEDEKCKNDISIEMHISPFRHFI